MTVALNSSLTAAWFLWTNQNALICKTADEFASFCIDNRLFQMAIFKSFSKWREDPLDLFFLLRQTKFCMIGLFIGLFQKKSTPPPEGLEGGQRPWKPRWEQGLNSKKSSAGVISTNSSCDLNVSFSDTFALIYPENSRSIFFTYISPDINDNLSSFAGPFIAENANKVLKTVTTLLERRICHAWHIFTRTQTQPATVE